MSIDTTPIGECAAQLMDALPGEADGEIVAMVIVVIVDAGEQSYTRVKALPDDRIDVQLGVLHAGIHAVSHDCD